MATATVPTENCLYTGLHRWRADDDGGVRCRLCGTPDALTQEEQIPASRIMRERDEHRANWAAELTRAEKAERELAEARQSASDWQAIALSNGDELARTRVELARAEYQIAASRSLADRYAKEVENLRQRLHSDLAAYRDSLVTIYDATAGQTGPVVDTIHATMRELAEGDLDDDDPMFDTCQTCGPFDRDYNPMPGCRDCFGGKRVAK